MNTGGKIIYDINFLLVWREKVLAQVVESTLIVWEDLGSNPMFCYYHVIYDKLDKCTLLIDEILRF